MQHYKTLAPLCKDYLGFDITKWPRYKAGASFLLHLSQPIGNGQRRCHPGGDTHPLDAGATNLSGVTFEFSVGVGF